MRIDEYRLRLDVDFRERRFRGALQVLGSFDPGVLTLNGVGLDITQARAGKVDLSVHLREPSQEIDLGGVPEGARAVEIDYRGRASEENLTGIYRSVQAPDYILTTQFEATGARRLLPCADRPDRKATFEVEVVTDADRDIIFNTPAIDTKTTGDRKRVRFARTPKMSTYLLYLGIGTFEVGRADGDRVATWTPPGGAERARFARDLASRILTEYEAYFGIPYPLPKLDLVSVREFGSGAMENWGAITFREMLLEADAATSTDLRRAIAVVAAHEIAHQWFGNLVTMHWWDDIWLNESFASFMSYKAIDRLDVVPAIWSEFLLHETSWALLGDSLPSARPIRQSVQSPDEIDQVFDEITYGKGASVLRMIEGFLGEEKFRRGVRDYLSQFQYANARSEDLWNALEAAAEQPVADTVRRWVERPGHPVLMVHRGSDGIHVEQRRFSLEGKHSRQYWPVPLVGRVDGRPIRMLLTGPEVTLNAPASSEINLNEEALGFYRVLYDPPTYEQLLGRFGSLRPTERWSLLRDLFAFLLSGDVPFERYLDYLRWTGGEREYLVIEEIVGQVNLLWPALAGTPRFVTTARDALRPQIERIGLERRSEEDEVDRTLREGVVGTLASLDPQFEGEIAEKFADYDRLDADLRGAVAVAYARTHGANVYDELRGRLQGANELETHRMLRALSSFDQPELVQRTLDAVTRGEVAFVDLPWALLEALQHPPTHAVTWAWLRGNLGWLEKAFTGISFLPILFERAIPRLGLSDEASVREFFASRRVIGAERAVQKGLEYLRILSAVRDRLR